MDPVGLELLWRMLEFNPQKRITAKNALAHQYFERFQPQSDILLYDGVFQLDRQTLEAGLDTNLAELYEESRFCQHLK